MYEAELLELMLSKINDVHYLDYTIFFYQHC